MPRLFIAIELPDDVKQLLGRLRVEIPGARWVPAGQLHLTLAFLGHVDVAAIDGLKRELSAIRLPGFRLRFAAPGCFPDRRRPRVLWVGLEPEPALLRLAKSVRDSLLICGIPREERGFSPHITLARLKLPAEREAAAFLQQTPERIPPLSVGEFILYESRLTSSGAIHTPLETFPLKPA